MKTDVNKYLRADEYVYKTSSCGISKLSFQTDGGNKIDSLCCRYLWGRGSLGEGLRSVQRLVLVIMRRANFNETALHSIGDSSKWLRHGHVKRKGERRDGLRRCSGMFPAESSNWGTSVRKLSEEH